MNAPVAATEDLIYSVEDGIARLTFNRPQARNALTFAMYEQMAVICETVNADRSIKAMVLTGTGDKAFASGTDISQFRAFKTAQDALDYEARIDRVLGALEACRVPVIAAIDEVKYETIEGLSYIASGVAQTDAAIPMVFRENLDDGPHDNSGINVSNLNLDAPQDVHITLVDKTGAEILDQPIVLTLPAGGSNYIYLPFIDTIPPGTLASVRITSSDPAGFVAISNDINYVVIGDGSVVFSAGGTSGYYRAVGKALP